MLAPGGLGMPDQARDPSDLVLHLLLDLVDRRMNGSDIRVRWSEAVEMHDEARGRPAHTDIVDRADLA